MSKKYKVTLTAGEQARLREIINKGKHSAQKRKRAQALLLAHEGYTDEVIADRVGMHYRGIEGLRQRCFMEDGFETVLEGKPRGHRPRALTGGRRGTAYHVVLWTRAGGVCPLDVTARGGHLGNP
jgi:hypothetical protein